MRELVMQIPSEAWQAKAQPPKGSRAVWFLAGEQWGGWCVCSGGGRV